MALVGSGHIAAVHLQVLRTLADVEVTALVDPRRDRAERLARRHGVPRAFGGLDDLIAAGGVDAVHVLVPPAAHVAVAARCLDAGWHVLVEKPLALRADEVGPLAAQAAAQQRLLAVNHNQTFHPSVRRLQDHLAAGRLGRLEHIAVMHHVPLRQLQSGDVGHFMFATEANILWEQGVHLFALLQALLGPCRAVQAATGARRELANGVRFVDDWLLRIDGERGTASVRLSFGRQWTETTVQAIGSDGSAWLDLQRGVCWLRRKTRWLEFLDHGRNLAGGACHLAGRAVAAVGGYGLGLFGLSLPDDPFLRGMHRSLRAFHAAVRGAGDLPEVATPAAAAAVLATCARVAAAAGVSTEPPPRPQLPAPGPARPGEVVVLGGTGLIGRRCVQRLLGTDAPVTLLVRAPERLPAALRAAAAAGTVRVFGGDAADPAALAAAFAGAASVLHLATAAGDGDEPADVAMAAAARAAGEAALAAGVRRFVYTSSTAALWLGGRGTIDGSVGPDPRPRARAPYARGKILAEHELGALRARGLPLVVVRPAIVVADDGPLEHSGVGLWVRDNHCVGWGDGRRPLPFVLADDCAVALVAALSSPAAVGRSYNLAGDVRLTAREWLEAMAVRTGRDYRFHGAPLRWTWLQEVGKHLVKVLAARPRQWPAWRDLASRSFRTTLDCRDAVRDLGFQPEHDRARFLARVFDGAKR